jgi:hypothetical protein
VHVNGVLSLLNATETICLVALFFVGDLPAALRDHAAAPFGKARGDQSARAPRYYKPVLIILRAALEELSESRFLLRYAAFLGDLAEALGRPGETVRGLEVIDEALARCEAGDEDWSMVELSKEKSCASTAFRSPSLRREALPAEPRVRPAPGCAVMGTPLRSSSR